MTNPREVRYASKIDIGMEYNSSNFTDPRFNTQGQKLAFAGGAPLGNGSNTEIYAQVRQTVWRPDPSKERSVEVFGGVLWDVSGHALVQNYFEAGVVSHGTFPGRDNDSLGFLFTHFLFNHRQTGAVNDRIAAAGLSGNVANTSQIIELNYGLSIAPGIQIKPYADMTFHPDQNLFNVPVPKPNVNYAFATGFQLSVLLNPALGLPSFFRDN